MIVGCFRFVDLVRLESIWFYSGFYLMTRHIRCLGDDIPAFVHHHLVTTNINLTENYAISEKSAQQNTIECLFSHFIVGVRVFLFESAQSRPLLSVSETYNIMFKGFHFLTTAFNQGLLVFPFRAISEIHHRRVSFSPLESTHSLFSLMSF